MYSEAAMTWFGTVATIFTFGSMAFSIIRAFLPSKQMQELDAILKETETLLHEAEEEALLQTSFLRHVKRRLSILQDAVLLIRSEVHAASLSYVQDYTGVFTGLAQKVSFISRGVKDLRATISRSSAEARMRLQEEERQAALESNCTGTDDAPTVGQHDSLPEDFDADGSRRSDSSTASLYTVDSEATVVTTDGAEPKDDTSLCDAAPSSASSIVASVRAAPMRLLGKLRATRTASASL